MERKIKALFDQEVKRCEALILDSECKSPELYNARIVKMKQAEIHFHRDLDIQPILAFLSPKGIE